MQHKHLSHTRYIGGTTNTQEALAFMSDQQFASPRDERPDVQDICIVVTDGRSNVMPDNTVPNAVRAQAQGIRMYVIGITNDVDEDELRQMSSSPQLLGQTYFLAPDFEDLVGLVDSVTRETCGVVDVGEWGVPPPPKKKERCVVLDPMKVAL